MITKEELIEEFVNHKGDLMAKRQKLDIIEHQMQDAAAWGYKDMDFGVHIAYSDYVVDKIKKAGFKVEAVKKGERVNVFKVFFQ